MKTRTLVILLVVTSCCWIIPTECKISNPALYGKQYIQWTSAGITAILLALGLFLSAHAVFSSDKPRKGAGWVCLGFVTTFSYLLALYGWAMPVEIMLTDSDSFLSMPNVLPKLLARLYAADTSEKQYKVAEAIYVMYGVAVQYKIEDGSYMTFLPTDTDKQTWLETQSTNEKATTVQKMLREQLRQLPFVSSAVIGSFFLTFWIGILAIIYRRKKTHEPPPARGI